MVKYLPANISARGHAALDGLGHVPGGLHELVLAQGVRDGGGHDLGAGHQLRGVEGALGRSIDNLDSYTPSVYRLHYVLWFLLSVDLTLCCN